MSDPEIDIMHIFNTENQREYYSNSDVSRHFNLMVTFKVRGNWRETNQRK